MRRSLGRIEVDAAEFWTGYSATLGAFARVLPDFDELPARLRSHWIRVAKAIETAHNETADWMESHPTMMQLAIGAAVAPAEDADDDKGRTRKCRRRSRPQLENAVSDEAEASDD